MPLRTGFWEAVPRPREDPLLGTRLMPGFVPLNTPELVECHIGHRSTVKNKAAAEDLPHQLRPERKRRGTHLHEHVNIKTFLVKNASNEIKRQTINWENLHTI